MKAKKRPTSHQSRPAKFATTATESDVRAFKHGTTNLSNDDTAKGFGTPTDDAAGEQPLHGRVRRVRAHVPTAAIRTLTTHLELTIKELTTLLGLTERTLARRLEQPESHLDTAESERLLLLRNLALHGLTAFEDSDKFNRWLRRPLPVLEGYSPLAYLDTVTSFQVVDQLLGRLEHGVYS